jgi:purine nucleosidase
MDRNKIILDIDNAMTIPAQDTDDGIALALALLSPEIELLGCTTCAGNCRTWQSTQNTLRMLEIAGRIDIPVAAGREQPLLQDVEPSLRYLEKKSAGPERRYWDQAPQPKQPLSKPSPLKAHEFIVQTVLQHPGQVTMVMAGALTNLALALLVSPEIATHILEVVHMGGSTGSSTLARSGTPDMPGPIWRDVLRFNTDFDPHAAEIVVRSGVPMTFVPGEVTSQVFHDLPGMARIGHVGSPFHRHLYDFGRPWIVWSMEERKLPGAHMHDPLTLALVIDRSFCDFESMRFDYRRFRSRDNPYLVPGGSDPQVQVATVVDKRRFEKWLADRLASPLV